MWSYCEAADRRLAVSWSLELAKELFTFFLLRRLSRGVFAEAVEDIVLELVLKRGLILETGVLPTLNIYDILDIELIQILHD